LQTGIKKIAGKDNKDDRAHTDDPSIEAIVEEASASGYRTGYRRIPEEIGEDVAGKEKSDAGDAEPATVEDVTKADGCPPDDPVGVDDAQDDAREDQIAFLWSADLMAEAEGRQGPEHGEGHPKEDQGAGKSDGDEDFLLLEIGCQAEKQGRDQDQLQDAMAGDEQRSRGESPSRSLADSGRQERSRHHCPGEGDQEGGEKNGDERHDSFGLHSQKGKDLFDIGQFSDGVDFDENHPAPLIEDDISPFGGSFNLAE
jgi:hypothetical protein